MKMKNTKDKVLGVLKKAKDKVIDKTATVIAAPKTMYYKSKQDMADIKYKDIINRRRLKQMDEAGVQDEGNESDDLFRYRVNEINKAFDSEQSRRDSLMKKQSGAVKSSMDEDLD